MRYQLPGRTHDGPRIRVFPFQQEMEIAALVANAPRAVLSNWNRQPSFRSFFDQLWAVSRQRKCTIEDLRDAAAAKE